MFESRTMIRWSVALILALLVLAPVRTGSEEDDDDNDSESDNSDEDESDDDVEPSMKELPSRRAIGGSGVNVGRSASTGSEAGDGGSNLRRKPPKQAVSQTSSPATRTMRRPLECYVCSYKSDSFLRSCLNPSQFRVHTMACHNVDDKCFTAVTSKGTNYEAVMRGCRSGCVATPETSCCATDRCNNQAMAQPVMAPKTLVDYDVQMGKADKPIPPTVLFFISVLLVLQTVVKVAVV